MFGPPVLPVPRKALRTETLRALFISSVVSEHRQQRTLKNSGKVEGQIVM